MELEPSRPYVCQTGHTGEMLPFAIAGPCCHEGAKVMRLRFSTKEDAHTVVELLHKLKALRHAGLAAIGFLNGVSILTKEQLQKTLVDAVGPL